MRTQNSRLSHDGTIIEKYDIDLQYASQYTIFYTIYAHPNFGPVSLIKELPRKDGQIPI
jgi:hypothetical protein